MLLTLVYLIFRSFNGSGSTGITGAGSLSEPCFFMFSVEKFEDVPETQVKQGIKGIRWFLPWLSSGLYLCFFIWTSHGIFAYRNTIGWKNLSQRENDTTYFYDQKQQPFQRAETLMKHMLLKQTAKAEAPNSSLGNRV